MAASLSGSYWNLTHRTSEKKYHLTQSDTTNAVNVHHFEGHSNTFRADVYVNCCLWRVSAGGHFSPANTWWRHQMVTISALLALCARVTDEFPKKGQWRGALMVYLICAWTNNRDAGDLRRQRYHCYVTVMRVRFISILFMQRRDSYSI